jgi:hypothetical protein
MITIRELNESLLNDISEFNDELITFNENCHFILEADEKHVAQTAASFLSNLAVHVKQGTVGNPTSAATKSKFGILAVLHLLPVSAKPKELDKLSIKRFLGNDPDTTAAEVSNAEKSILASLSKLHHGELTGPKCKDHYISLYKEDPDKLHKEILTLKRKYSKIVKYQEEEK